MPMTATRIIVTGGNGFIGTAIVNELTEQIAGCEITVVDKKPKQARHGSDHKYEFVQLDISDSQSVTAAINHIKPDVIIHTAGVIPSLYERYSRRLEKQVKDINVGGTRNIIDAARGCGCRAFVFTSSCCSVTDDLSLSYPNINESWPVSRQSSIYGESKVEAEELVLTANNDSMATCVLRPAVVFGEGDQQLIPTLHNCIAKGETPFKLGDGLNLWDTIYVGNVAQAHVLAVQDLLSSKLAAGEAFFIQNNEPVSFRDFSLAVWKEFGHYPPFEVRIPASLGMMVGFVAEWWTWLTGTATTISRGSVRDACATRYASGEKARRLLGYEPRVSLEEGLRRSCKDFMIRQRNNKYIAT